MVYNNSENTKEKVRNVAVIKIECFRKQLELKAQFYIRDAHTKCNNCGISISFTTTITIKWASYFLREIPKVIIVPTCQSAADLKQLPA